MVEDDPNVVAVLPFSKRVTGARSIVVLTGAGVSVASGFKPYRGPGGLWTMNHTKAGSLNVIEFHGALKRLRCSAACGAEPFIDDRDEGPAPRRERCGAPVRPDIVLFNEVIGAREDWSTKRALRNADLFVAIGTSGTVSPASNFVRSAAYAGAHTVLINLEVPDSAPFVEIIRGEAQTLVPELFA